MKPLYPLANLVLILLLLSISLFYSCQTESKEQNLQEDNKPKILKAELVLVDSIIIDVMGNFDVYDYNPKTKLFLAGDIKQQGVMTAIGVAMPVNNKLGHMVINQEGKIVYQFNRTDKGPKGHQGNAAGSFFMDDKHIGVINRSGLFQYELDGTFVKKYKDFNTLNAKRIVTPASFIRANSDGMIINALPKWDYGNKADENDIKPVRFYNAADFKSGYEEAYILVSQKYDYPDHPIYAAGSKLSSSSYPPIVSHNLSRNELNLVFRDVPEIRVFDFSTGELKRTINMKPEHWGKDIEMEDDGGENFGLAWTNKGGVLATSKIHVFKDLGEYSLVVYNNALPEEILTRFLNSSELYANLDEWPQIRKKHYNFYFSLYKGDKKVLPDFRIPKFEPQKGQKEFKRTDKTRGKILGGDGLDRIYVFEQNDGNYERDYELINIYALKLVKQ